jgi:YHS domain-containing protein
MGPFRLIILAILFYIGYRLLTSGRNKKSKEGRQKTVSENAGPVSDVLVEDPVCHCLVPKGQAIRLQHNSKILYFCSEDCCNKFIEKGKDS